MLLFMPGHSTICDICSARIAPHDHYVVRIDVFADPTVPETTSQEIEELHAEAAIESLIAQMQDMSEEELQDQVHRRFEFRLCPACHRNFLANPLGLPRARRPAQN